MEGRDQVRVLLVEDDEDDFILVRDLLGEQDRTRCEVDWANDPARALSLIRGARHDVYLIDHRLGARTGLELVRDAFGDQAHAPVIMLTGYDDYRVDLEAELLGVTDFLIKDRLDAVSLERSIRYAVRQLEKLQRLGGRFAQGYLFAKPLEADRAEDLLASWDPTRFAAAALN